MIDIKKLINNKLQEKSKSSRAASQELLTAY